MSVQLSGHIAKLIPSFEKEIQNVLPYFEKQTYAKNQVLITEQTAVDSFYFVNTGCLQLYFTDNLGNQKTVHFALENWWITEYNSF